MTLAGAVTPTSNLKRQPANQLRHFDVAVVGAGILGLAHALQAARRGLRVAVFERDPRALGASIRNFGLILPTGMAAGRPRRLALQSRAEWLALAKYGGFWHSACGLLLAAYRPEEMQILAEFAQGASGAAEGYTLLTAEQVAARSPAINRMGLLGGLDSASEVLVDAPQALDWLPGHLRAQYRVEFFFGETVLGVGPHEITTSSQRWQVGRSVVCSGVDFETLFPALLQQSGLVKCKLQMLRTVPQPREWKLGPVLATGLSLPHYAAFAECASLPALRSRLAQEHPQLIEHGIHLLVAQTEGGALLVGDSHEYGSAVNPFDSVEIDELILSLVQHLLVVPRLALAQRWHGAYARHPALDTVILSPYPSVRVVAGAAGAGMTLSFGLAGETFDNWL